MPPFQAVASQVELADTHDVLRYLNEATPVSIEVAEATAIDELLGDGLRAQGTLYTETLTAVDLYDAPFVHIVITSPKRIGDLWTFAESLKGDEWPEEEASAWGITITSATEAREPISQIEYGLDTFEDIYQTVKAMGGPSKLKKVVSPLSAIFWLEHQDGSLWDIGTRKKVSDEQYEQAKEMYDDILSGIEVGESETVMATAWAAQSTLNTASVTKDADGSYDLADFASVNTQATTYQYSGAWTNPEAGQRTLMGAGGYAQEDFYYDRSGKWRVGTCVGGSTSTANIGCGPAALSAMLFYHFKYRNERIKGYKYGDTAFKLKHFVTAPVGAKGVPRLIDYMGSCFVAGGVATSGGAFSNGSKAFLKDHASNLKIAYNWSRGFSNPRRVDDKVDNLNFAKGKKLPSLVLYPSSFATFHYSFIKAWRAKRRGAGLFIRPENSPTFWVNMGDTFRGEVGVWTIY